MQDPREQNPETEPDRKARRIAQEKRKRRIRQRNRRVFLFCLGMVLLVILGGRLLSTVRTRRPAVRPIQEQSEGPTEFEKEGAPHIDVELLDPNEYSRPQIPLEEVKHIAIHYTANPGSTAMDNRNYFNNLAATHETKASSHFVVGLEGEVIQCIPTAEISYATNERNVDTLSIECCHWDESGEFSEATYDSVVKLTAWLCTRFGITQDDVIRHYDVTGKLCPKYYVEHPDEWEQMKRDIGDRIQVDYDLQADLY